MFNKENDGFSREEVKNFISKQRAVYENLLIKQRDKITALKTKIVRLDDEIEEYKRTEQELIEAFEVVVAQNKEIKEAQDNVKLMEIERLRNLYEKYRDLFEQKLRDENVLIEDALNLENEISNIFLSAGLAQKTEQEFDILAEIKKDVEIDTAFEGFDFYNSKQKSKKRKKKKAAADATTKFSQKPRAVKGKKRQKNEPATDTDELGEKTMKELNKISSADHDKT